MKKDSMIYKYLMILIATCTTVVYFIPYACYDFYKDRKSVV